MSVIQHVTGAYMIGLILQTLNLIMVVLETPMMGLMIQKNGAQQKWIRMVYTNLDLENGNIVMPTAM